MMKTEQNVSCHLLVTLGWQQQAGAHRHSIKMALTYIDHSTHAAHATYISTLHPVLVIGHTVTSQIIWSSNMSRLHHLKTVLGDKENNETASTERTLKYTDVYCSLLLASLVWVSWSITSTICRSDWRSCTHYWSHRKGMALCWTSLCKTQQNLEGKTKLNRNISRPQKVRSMT